MIQQITNPSEKYILHFLCPHCQCIDIVDGEKAKEWICPSCLIQKEKKCTKCYKKININSTYFQGRVITGNIVKQIDYCLKCAATCLGKRCLTLKEENDPANN